MVKLVSSVAQRGLRDWIIQRVSAITMAVYSIGLVLYVAFTPGLSFAEWHGLFSQVWMKVATMVVLLGLMFHAWIGMWTIYTDYVKPFVIRCILNTLTILMLVACFFWGVMILWSV